MEISTLDAAVARRALLRQWPQQDFGALRLLGEGWDSIVYLAGDTTVLRFPKSSNAARYYHPDWEGLFRKLEAFRLLDATRYVSYGQARADSETIRDGLIDLRELLRVRLAHASET